MLEARLRERGTETEESLSQASSSKLVFLKPPSQSVLGSARGQAQGARHRDRGVTQPGKFFQIGFPQDSVPGDARGKAQGARNRDRGVTQPGKFFQIGFPQDSVPGDARSKAQGARNRDRGVTKPGKFFQIVFSEAPSLEVLEARLRERGTETEESLSQASSSK